MELHNNMLGTPTQHHRPRPSAKLHRHLTKKAEHTHFRSESKYHGDDGGNKNKHETIHHGSTSSALQRRTQNLAVKSKSLKQEHLWAGDTRGKWGSKLTQQKTHPKRLETLGGHKYGMRHVHVQSLSHTFANEGQHDSVMHERMLIQPLGHENWRISKGAHGP